MADESKVVKIPGGREISFPSHMSDEDIVSAIERTISGQAKPEPTMGETIQLNLENTLPIAGGVAGATLAAPAPVPGAPVLGAALGSMAGHAAADITKPILAPSAEPESVLEKFRSLVQTGALSMVGEGAVQVGGKVILPFLGRTIKRALVGEIEPAVEAAQGQLAQRGTTLSMGQLAGEQHAVANVLDTIGRESILGSRVYAKLAKGQGAAIDDMAADIAANVGSRLNNSQ